MEFFEALSFMLLKIIIPIVVIVVLLYLILLLNELRQTLKKYDELAVNLQEKANLLDGPIQSILMAKESFDATFQSIKAMLDIINTLPSWLKNKITRKRDE